jgi:hypothetical protein
MTAVPKQQTETIRQWYYRTTRRPRKAILYASILAFVGMWLAWKFMPVETQIRIQSFNSALTIPTLAILWTSALVFMFLKPTREAAFRSQETLDAGIGALEGRLDVGIKALEKRLDTVTTILSKALDSKIIPAMDCWNRVGQRIEDVIVNQGLLEEVKRVMGELSEGVKRMEAHATDVKPTILALKGIQEKLDHCFDENFVDDLKLAVEGLREFNRPPTQKAVKKSVPKTVVPESPPPAPASLVAPEASESPEFPKALPLRDVSHPVVIKKIKPIPEFAAPVQEKTPEPDFDLALRTIGKKKVKIS